MLGREEEGQGFGAPRRARNWDSLQEREAAPILSTPEATWQTNQGYS